jgi:uncharacterized membrane protein YeiH
MLTGVGGGVVRDVLAGEIPLVLKSEVYAVASLLGAIIIIVASEAQALGTVSETMAAVAVFALRMVSVWKRWRIPVARSRRENEGGSGEPKKTCL